MVYYKVEMVFTLKKLKRGIVMDKIIATLNIIEERAARITEATVNEKNALRESYAKRISDYEAQVEKDTAMQLEKLHNDMDTRIQSRLSSLESDSKKERAALKEYFEANHEQLADQIFRSIVGE